uniref:hypothetical protein n=1 Tax=Candidatus Scatousia sp. TaxID=3085663 RepID=UPI004027D2B5
MNNNITFGANFIQKIPIKKYSYNTKTYNSLNANFIELKPSNAKDVNALGDIAFDFGGDSFANNIYVQAKINSKHPDEKYRYFALTEQDNDFEKLNVNQILGVALTKKKLDGVTELENLQVHPKFVYSWGPPSIKRVGSAILDCLKEFNDKIILNSSPNATKFYEKNAFMRIDPKIRRYFWSKES